TLPRRIRSGRLEPDCSAVTLGCRWSYVRSFTLHLECKMRTRLALSIILMLLVSLSVAAELSPWPRFRGPDGSGIAADSQPPTQIGPETNVKWKIAVPSGLSSPIIVGDLVVVTAFDDGKLFTIAYRQSDGKEAWRADARAKEIEAFHKTE